VKRKRIAVAIPIAIVIATGLMTLFSSCSPG